MTRHKLSLTEAMLFETEKSMSPELRLWYFLEPISVLHVDCLDWSSLHWWLVIVWSSAWWECLFSVCPHLPWPSDYLTQVIHPLETMPWDGPTLEPLHLIAPKRLSCLGIHLASPRSNNEFEGEGFQTILPSYPRVMLWWNKSCHNWKDPRLKYCRVS